VAIDALCHRLTIEQAPRGDTEAARELLGETLDATAVPTMVSAPASDTPLATDGGE
jgi:hypothetical protein